LFPFSQRLFLISIFSFFDLILKKRKKKGKESIKEKNQMKTENRKE